MLERGSGILMHISSLSSRYGVGSFGTCAYKFIDFLKFSGQKYWQVLPLCPVDATGSPYQSFSTFAGNFYFIDLDILKDEGLLELKDLCGVNWGANEEILDFKAINFNRLKILKLAYSNWKDYGEVSSFIKENDWALNYAVFMTLLEKNKYKPFWDWADEYKFKDGQAIKSFISKNERDINFWVFLQIKFYSQWHKLKCYANKNGIKIIGDLPIYVSGNSADVWENPKNFCLNEDMTAKKVAGCPPDAFSKTGQLWGNPTYNWDYMSGNKYAWWANRLGFYSKIYDIVRIDHFRGFDSFYVVDATQKTAVNGVWERGPGLSFFNTISKKLGKLNVIAEDLGYITDSVKKLLKDTGFPGMKILQHAFDSREDSDSDCLPHNYNKNCVVYIGTHDNNTAIGWYNDINIESKKYCNRYINIENENNINWQLIRFVMSTVCSVSIIQMQDILGLGSSARMNTPATVGINWKWRIRNGACKKELGEKLYSYTKLYGRA